MQDTPPNPYQIERGHVVGEEGRRGGLQYRTNTKGKQEPLEYYFTHGHITARQRRAGKRFQALHDMSRHRHRHVQARYEEAGGGTCDHEARFMISVRYVEATRAIRGTMEQHHARKVCIDGEKAGRANMHYLKSALDDLAAYFQIETKQLR